MARPPASRALLQRFPARVAGRQIGFDLRQLGVQRLDLRGIAIERRVRETGTDRGDLCFERLDARGQRRQFARLVERQAGSRWTRGGACGSRTLGSRIGAWPRRVLRRGFAAHLPLRPVAVAARVLAQFPVTFERDDLRHHVVEKHAVMADKEDRAAVFLQQRLEQLQRLDVEVVGRLVQHQHVDRLREQAREQQPVALAARERAYR